MTLRSERDAWRRRAEALEQRLREIEERDAEAARVRSDAIDRLARDRAALKAERDQWMERAMQAEAAVIADREPNDASNAPGDEPSARRVVPRRRPRGNWLA